MSIIPVLTKALQEQQGLIAKQQELVAKQQQEIDELKKMVKRMSLR
jgi:cell division protein FtsL